MTGAELKTFREALGLAVPWLAVHAVSPRTGQPVGERTVRYWESGSVPVPDDVASLIQRTEAMIQRRVDETIAKVEKSIAAARAKRGVDGGSAIIELQRYLSDTDLWRADPEFQPLPATCHAAMLARVVRSLEARGVRCRIDYSE